MSLSLQSALAMALALPRARDLESRGGLDGTRAALWTVAVRGASALEGEAWLAMGVTSIASAAPAKTVNRATGPTSLPLNLKFMFILLAHAAVEVGATGRATGPPSERPTAVVADFQVARRRDDGVGVRRLADFVPANPSVGVLVRLPHRLRIADEVGLAQHGHVDVRLACPAAAFARTPDDGRLRALPVLDLQVDLGVREARFDLDRGNLVLHGLAHSADIPGHHSGGFRLGEFRGDVRPG
jgi:hypothetical protein